VCPWGNPSLPQIVGYEGLFGVIFTLGLMAPAAYYLPGTEGEGVHEDGLDTLAVSDRGVRLNIVGTQSASSMHEVIVSSGEWMWLQSVCVAQRVLVMHAQGQMLM
jgi:hypothetical protein